MKIRRLAVFVAILVCGLIAAAVVTGAGTVLSPGSWSLQPGGVYTLSVPPQDTVTVTNTVTTTVTTTTTAPPVTTANVWVNTVAGANPTRCATACAYDPTKAFGPDFNAAYAATSLGDKILIKSGLYGGQYINATTKAPCGGQEVLMQPEPGATVTLNSDLEISAGCVHVKDVSGPTTTLEIADYPGQSCASSPVQNVTVENYTAAVLLLLGPVNGTTIQGGNFGPTTDYHSVIGNFNSGQPDACNTKLYTDVFHDVSTSGNPGVHTECFQIYGGIVPVNLDIQGSRFIRCPEDNGTGTVTAAVSLGGADGLKFINNLVGHGSGGVYLSPNIRNLQFDYNTIYSDIAWFSGSCTSFANCGIPEFIGNILGGLYYGSCPERSGVTNYTWKYNVGVDIGLGDCANASHDTIVSSWAAINYVDYPNENFHILTTSPAKGAGDPNYCPPVDGDNQVRPQGTGNCDAGYDEIA